MRSFLLSLFFAFSLFSSPSILRERFEKAKNGDYIVMESQQMITVLAIRSHTAESILLEEISVPRHSFKELPTSWPDWVKKKAPGHSSWSMVEIDLTKGVILECYSFSKSAWVEAAKEGGLFPTLLSLEFAKIEPQERKKIGPPPLSDEEDRRKVWEPPFTFQGEKREAVFEAYRALWPKDGSEIAGKEVSLYFDQKFFFPLPFWIQIDASYGAHSVKVIDSGRALPCHYRSIPRRVPEFLGTPQKTQEGLKLSVKSPQYYHSFELFVIDVTTKEQQIIPITHFLKKGEGEFLTLEIPEDALKQVLEPEHSYTWLLVPKGHTESYTEMRKPFLFSDKK